jgi:hypothetical protein
MWYVYILVNNVFLEVFGGHFLNLKFEILKENVVFYSVNLTKISSALEKFAKSFITKN